MELRIDMLRLRIDNAVAQEHRIHPIAMRAATLFAERAERRFGDAPIGSREVGPLSAAPLNVDLNRSTDDQAASDIANAWLEALALRLEA